MIDLQQHDYIRTLETAIQFGLPVLLQNVHEVLDPSLDPILNKSIVKIGKLSLLPLDFTPLSIPLAKSPFSILRHRSLFPLFSVKPLARDRNVRFWKILVYNGVYSLLWIFSATSMFYCYNEVSL